VLGEHGLMVPEEEQGGDVLFVLNVVEGEWPGAPGTAGPASLIWSLMPVPQKNAACTSITRDLP